MVGLSAYFLGKVGGGYATFLPVILFIPNFKNYALQIIIDNWEYLINDLTDSG